MFKNKDLFKIIISTLIIMLLCIGCSPKTVTNAKETKEQLETSIASDNNNIPKYTGQAYVVLNNNIPSFKDSELKLNSYEHYGELDSLGRCTVAKANIDKDLMPTSERESIGNVKPSGWHTVKYDCVDGKYLYNRCHLIGFQLTGENANDKNLITGTRYMNVEGMLPFEDMVADYIKETTNHVLYCVTPIFEGNNLVATGVQMEAKSVEDKGEGVCFNVFVFNVQPGVTIDYATGESNLSGSAQQESISDDNSTNTTKTYILNINTKKYHNLGCSSISHITKKHKKTFKGNVADIEQQGYEACKNCH